MLGAEVGSPSVSLAAEIESLLTAAASDQNNVLARDDEGGRFPGGGLDLFALMANRAFEVHGKPLLFAAEVNAYSTSENPCAPELSIECGGVGRAMEAAVNTSTRAGVTRM